MTIQQASEYLRWALIIAHMIVLLSAVWSWKLMRFLPFFCLLTALNLWQLAWNSPSNASFWTGRWMPLERVILLAWIGASIESHLNLMKTRSMSSRERASVFIAFGSIAAAFGFICRPGDAGHTALAEFLAIRQQIHCGLAAFLLGSSLYMWLRPFRVGIVSAAHAVLLSALALAHLISELAPARWWWRNIAFRLIWLACSCCWAGMFLGLSDRDGIVPDLPDRAIGLGPPRIS